MNEDWRELAELRNNSLVGRTTDHTGTSLHFMPSQTSPLILPLSLRYPQLTQWVLGGSIFLWTHLFPRTPQAFTWLALLSQLICSAFQMPGEALHQTSPFLFMLFKGTQWALSVSVFSQESQPWSSLIECLSSKNQALSSLMFRKRSTYVKINKPLQNRKVDDLKLRIHQVVSQQKAELGE